MSTSRVDTSGLFGSAKLHQYANLTLTSDALKVRKNGIEFRTFEPIPNWTELSIDLVTPSSEKITCRGVVVSCNGNRHQGYIVSLLFMNISEASQASLDRFASSNRSH